VGALAHTPKQLPSKQINHNYPWKLVFKPQKECSTPSQAPELLSGINSRHTQPRVLIACQLLNARGLGTPFASPDPHDIIKAPDPYVLSGTTSASPDPHGVIKAPDPYALLGTTFASPDPYNVNMGAPDPLGVLLPRLRDTWSPQARREAMRTPTTTPIPAVL
jgi:hypothetical protein